MEVMVWVIPKKKEFMGIMDKTPTHALFLLNTLLV